MTTLEVLEPELYKWICNNKEAVCGGFMHGLLSHSSNKPDYRNLYYNEFKSLGIDPDLAISCVSTMFPVFANDVSRYPFLLLEPTSLILQQPLNQLLVQVLVHQTLLHNHLKLSPPYF